MQQNNVKSATTAGLLGIFLGAFGAHNWYLGDKKKGIIHVSLVGGGIAVLIIANVIIFAMGANNPLYAAALTIVRPWWYWLLTAVGSLAISASGIWGVIEGIIILTQGDAGLAQKGYAVAQPMNGYNQPMNNGYGPMNGYNQPMNNGYGMPNNMNNGYNQPMDNMGGMDNNMNNNGGNKNGQQ